MRRRDRRLDRIHEELASKGELQTGTDHPAAVSHVQISNRSVGHAVGSRQIQRAATAGVAFDEDLASGIQALRGRGSALAGPVCASMEAAFNADFSRVRVHTSGKAHTLSERLSARAFTAGDDIFFARGNYTPSSASGRSLLGHELTHVLQQRSGTSGWRPDGVSHPSDTSERQAEAVGRGLADRSPRPDCAPAPPATTLATDAPSAGAAIQRKTDESCPRREPGEVAETVRAVLTEQPIDDHRSRWIISGFPVGASIPLFSDLDSLLEPIDRRLEEDIYLGSPNAPIDYARFKRRLPAVIGFSDCHGSADINTTIRLERAQTIALLFSQEEYAPKVFAAESGAYLASNATRSGRRANRAVVILEVLVDSKRPGMRWWQEDQENLERRAEAFEEARSNLPAEAKELRTWLPDLLEDKKGLHIPWVSPRARTQRETVEGLLDVLAGSANDEYYTGEMVINGLKEHEDHYFRSSAREHAARALADSEGDRGKFIENLFRLDSAISNGVAMLNEQHGGVAGLMNPGMKAAHRWCWDMSKQAGSLMSYYVQRSA